MSEGLPFPRPLARRAAVRAPIMVPVRYSSARLQFKGMSMDISELGVFVLSPLCDNPGTIVELEFVNLGGQSALTVVGQVVRVSRGSRPGMGVVFVRQVESTRAFLREYCEKFAALLR